MATNRDVKMTLSVDTLGEDGIKSLQKSIQSLASEGGDAAPEFQKLADEVGRLGEQSKALTAFKELGAVTDTLATKQADAVQTSTNLSAKLDTLKTATQEAKVKQQEAAAALAAGQVAAVEAGGALRLLKSDYDNAGKQTAEFKTKQTELIGAQTAAKVALVELRTAQREANTELSAAEAAQKSAESAYNRSEKAVKATSEALAKQEVVVKEAAAATEKLGLSATDVATSEGVLLAALNKVGSEAAQHSAAIKEMAESDRLLAIQEKGLADLFARGADALQAETLAQRDADRSNAEYAASLAKVNAEKARSVDTAAQWQREAEAIVNAAEAAQKLERDTIDLLRAEQQLAANNAFAQQAADAQKLVQAADYVQFWTTELDRAAAAAKQLQGAFNALNVRSAEAIRADIAAVRSALETVKAQATATGQTMSGAFDAGKAKIAALELEMRQLNGTMTLGDKTSKLLSNSLGQISAGNLVADGIGYLVNKVKELGRAFLDAVVQGDQMRRGLNAVYKDTEVTARQIDFLRKTASESGVSLGALSGEFVRFSASMKSANVPMAESNALFRAVTAASAALGLGAEATSGALNALGQMASKGTVSMEELRQQLGDRLPGALGLAAKGMGITEAQLIALVSSGGLATRDFIVPFTNALETMRGEVDGLTPAWGRFSTALTTIAQNAGDAGWVQILTVALKGLAAVVGTAVMSVSLASEGILFLSKALTAAAARMMGDKDAFKFLAEEADKAANRINASNAALVAVIDPSKAAAGATTAHAAALTANTAEVTKSIAANTALSAEQNLTALSTALAGDKTLDASAKMVQYNVAAAELIAKQGLQTESYGKLAKAAKEEGDTLVAMAKLTGDVNAVQTDGVQAAGMHAAALEKLAVSQAAELKMLTAQKAEIIENSKGIEGGTAARQGLIDKIDALIVKSKAETEQSVQASAAAKQQVLERALLSQATLDHSGAVDVLKAAMDDATGTLQSYEFFAKAGLFTEEEVKAKRQELTVVTALYRDALKDSVVQIQLAEKAITAESSVTKDAISNRITHNDLLIKEATLRGDVNAVAKLELTGKQLVIDQLKAEIAGRTAANDIALKLNDANRKLIDSSTDLGKQQLKELDVSDQLIKSKQALNLAGLDVVKGLEKERDASTAAANGMMSLVDAYKQLGLQSPQELAKVAQASADAWAAIKSDTTASVATLKSAFEAYANAAIAASGEVGSSQRQVTENTLAQEAAVNGLTVTFDEAGKMIVKSMNEGANAVDRVSESTKQATNDMDAFAQSTSEATTELAKQQAAEKASREDSSEGLSSGTMDLVPSFSSKEEGEQWFADYQENLRNGSAGGMSMTSQAVNSWTTAEWEAEMDRVRSKDAVAEKLKAEQDLAAEKERVKQETANALNSGATPQDILNFQNAANYTSGLTWSGYQAQQGRTQSTTSTQTTPSTPTSTKTVTININGRSQSVNVASDADATALTGILRTLETAANTSS